MNIIAVISRDRFAFGDTDGNIRIWSIEKKTEIKVLTNYSPFRINILLLCDEKLISRSDIGFKN